MVFDAHDRAFALFKGTCSRGIYGNMKTAVETIFVGNGRPYNRRFMQMCSHYLVDPVAYNASKAALNMLTVQLNEELRGTGIVVNSVSPGSVKTDLTGYGSMTPEEGAVLPVRYALNVEVSGRSVEPNGETPW